MRLEVACCADILNFFQASEWSCEFRLGIRRIDEAIVFESCVTNAGALFADTLDFPNAIVIYESHLASLAPPFVKFTGETDPKV